MFTQVRMQYFQRHEDLTVDFGPGLGLVRAPNEGGKSTIIRAALYALYGSRALPATLASIVTWGKKDSQLKVELDIEIKGKKYTFTRAKSGAEVIVDGNVYVSGQTDVSDFASDLLGADLNAANRLMVANQNNLRGALESGPKAAAEMVESLADFELFDTLLDRASKQLTLGSDVPARQRLEQAEEHLETLEAVKPDTSEYSSVVRDTPAQIAKVEKKIKEKLEPAYETARQALDRAKNNRSTYDLLNNNLKKVQNSLDEAKTQQIAAQERITEVDPKQVAILQGQLESAKTFVQQRDVFDKLQTLDKSYPEMVWEKNSESLQAEITKTETEVDAATHNISANQQEIGVVQSDIRDLERQIQKDDKCGSCGQLLQDHEQIAKRNAEVEKQVKTLNDQLTGLRTHLDKYSSRLTERRDYLKDLKAVQASALPFDNFIRDNAQYLNVDSGTVPAKITWKGAEPSDDLPIPTEIAKKIAAIEDTLEANRNAKARIEALQVSVQEYTSQVAEMTKQIDGYSLENVGIFQEASDDAYTLLNNARGQVEELQSSIREAETQIKLLEQAYEQQKKDIANAQSTVAMCKEDIKTLAFNNTLVKRIRELRPTVANQLWNMILAAVSTMFSTMRCQQSVVTRDKDGFKVNGESIETLSGSTLDLLGLAIRVALIKTFIPKCGLLILDEPAGSFDTERTKELMAFLGPLEFEQIIMITHEETSSQAADYIVELEA